MPTPTKELLFDPDRDANPFFHFMEGLWMLAGFNDLKSHYGVLQQRYA